MAIAYEDTSESRIGFKAEVKHRRSSLFTSEDDKRLPLLTQIAQLQDGEETAFIRHLHKDLFGYPESLMRRPLAEHEITELRGDRDMARTIMEQLADVGGVHREQVRQLSDRLNEYRPKLSLFGPDRGDGIIPAGEVCNPTERWSRAKEVCNLVLKDLHLVVNQPGRVRRCASCGNPYHVQRDTGENRYCSNRCSNRIRARRSKQKSGNETSSQIAV